MRICGIKFHCKNNSTKNLIIVPSSNIKESNCDIESQKNNLRYFLITWKEYILRLGLNFCCFLLL